MRIFIAGLVLAATIAGAVALNDYRASVTQRRCITVMVRGESCAEAARRSDLMFGIANVDRSGYVSSSYSWKPRWVLPASIFLAIVGAGAAAGLATKAAPLRVRS